MEEHAIVPSQIIWTSMWAIIGGAWAVGLTAQEIIDAIKSISWASLFDVDFKTASIQWWLVEKLLTTTLGDIQIEDITIPYGCTATCLEDWTSKLFTTWPLIDAIRASISVPGLFSPQSIDWHTYIDWWLTANLPIQYASYHDVIAISAARAQDLEIERTSQFRKREIPKNPLTINKEILSKSYNLLINTQENQAIALSDKNITLIRPYNAIRLLDMEKIDDGVALGYAEAKRVLWG
jgi:predicted acylesterase/phospholipase RssA